MNNRLIFQFYHKGMKKIFEVKSIDFDLSLVVCGDEQVYDEFSLIEGELRQCTGLKA